MGTEVKIATRGKTYYPGVPDPEYPWDRKLDESSIAYRQFCFFRDMGIDRTLVRVATETKKHYSTIISMVKRHEWHRRVQAYDVHLEILARELNEKKKVQMMESQAELGTKMQGMATQGMDMLDLTEVSASDLVRMADTGVKIERLARGESTENIHSKSMQVVFEGPEPEWAKKNKSEQATGE